MRQDSCSPSRTTAFREPGQQNAEFLECQYCAPLQPPSDLDAGHLKDACAALLLAARQLLEKTQELAASNHREYSISVPLDVLGSFCDADQESSPCSSVEVSDKAPFTPAGSAMWSDRVDILPLDLDDWTGRNLWQPDDGAGVRYAFGGTSGCVGHSYDDLDWPVLQTDDWPRFPG